MKKYVAVLAGASIWLVSATPSPAQGFLSPRAKAEKSYTKCDSGARPLTAVMDFTVSSGHGAGQELGGGLAKMLSNALVETKCFRVVDRANIDKLRKEKGLGMSGEVSSASAVQMGKMLGAQLSVFGEVTEYKEEVAKVGGGIKLGPFGDMFGMSTAHVGLILQLIDSSTGEIYASKSVDKEVRKVGAASGGSLWGVTGGAVGYKSMAMQDAVEQAINEAVAFLVEERESWTSANPASGSPTPQGVSTPSPASTPGGDCQALTSATAPRIMVMIPEIHIKRQVPDPAGETEIIRKFVEKGFSLVDQGQIAAIRYQEKALSAVKDAQAAAALGLEFGADIIVIGEAFSEFASREAEWYTCRARVEARAIQTRTGRILAADGKHAGAKDLSELIAGKAALREAGSLIADYFVEQLCRNTDTGNPKTAFVEILLTNVDFTQTTKFIEVLKSIPGVQEVKRTMTGNTARLQVQNANSAESLAEEIDAKKGKMPFSITGLSGNKIEVAYK